MHVDRLKLFIERCTSDQVDTRGYYQPEIVVDPAVNDLPEDGNPTQEPPDSLETPMLETATSKTRSGRQSKLTRHFGDYHVYHVTAPDEFAEYQRISGDTYKHSGENTGVARIKSVARQVLAMPKCPLCSEIFNDVEAVMEHIGAALSKRRHECPMCDYSSERKTDVRRHIARKHASDLHNPDAKKRKLDEDDVPARRPTCPACVHSKTQGGQDR